MIKFLFDYSITQEVASKSYTLKGSKYFIQL